MTLQNILEKFGQLPPSHCNRSDCQALDKVTVNDFIKNSIQTLVEEQIEWLEKRKRYRGQLQDEKQNMESDIFNEGIETAIAQLKNLL